MLVFKIWEDVWQLTLLEQLNGLLAYRVEQRLLNDLLNIPWFLSRLYKGLLVVLCLFWKLSAQSQN